MTLPLHERHSSFNFSVFNYCSQNLTIGLRYDYVEFGNCIVKTKSTYDINYLDSGGFLLSLIKLTV